MDTACLYREYIHRDSSRWWWWMLVTKWVGNKFWMLVTSHVTNIKILAPTSKTCHHFIWSPTSVTNIDVTCYCPDGYILDRDKLCLTTRMQLYIWWRNFSHWKQEKLRLLVVYLWKWKLELSKWPRSVYWQQEKDQFIAWAEAISKKILKNLVPWKKYAQLVWNGLIARTLVKSNVITCIISRLTQMKISIHGVVQKMVELRRAQSRLRAHFDRISHTMILSKFQN